MEAKLESLAATHKKDNTLTFEELGIDRLFVDEAHYFKNLFYISKMTRIAGLPQTASERAFDMYLKVRHIQSVNGGGGVVFATGTPIANSMAEMFTMQRYLQPEDLKKHNLNHFDSWAATFGEPVTAMELAPDGAGYRLNTRFARFINVPELMQIFRQSADMQTAQMLNLARPKLEGEKPAIRNAPASPELKKFVEGLARRAEALKRGRVDPREDNMLKITTEGRKAALDLRLMKPGLPDDPQSKVNLAVENIHRIWEATKDDRLAQLVFCDLSTPQDRGFSVYNDMADKLKRLGIPATDIAFIQDYDADNAKLALFRSVRAGKVRILVRQHAENGFGNERPGAVDCACIILMLRGDPPTWSSAKDAFLRQGNKNSDRADLSLRHRRLVRCLYVADVGNQGQVHLPSDERRHDHAPPRRHGLRRVDLCRGQSHRVRQSARHRKSPGGCRVDPVDPAALRPCRGTISHPRQPAPFTRGGAGLDGTARKFARGFDAPAGHFRRQIPHRTGQADSGQSRRRRGIAVAAGGENQNPFR